MRWVGLQEGSQWPSPGHQMWVSGESPWPLWGRPYPSPLTLRVIQS